MGEAVPSAIFPNEILTSDDREVEKKALETFVTEGLVSLIPTNLFDLNSQNLYVGLEILRRQIRPDNTHYMPHYLLVFHIQNGVPSFLGIKQNIFWFFLNQPSIPSTPYPFCPQDIRNETAHCDLRFLYKMHVVDTVIGDVHSFKIRYDEEQAIVKTNRGQR